MLLTRIGRVEDAPLEFRDVPEPVPAAGEILIKVSACGVCHIELDEIEGRTPPPRLSLGPTANCQLRAGRPLRPARLTSACRHSKMQSMSAQGRLALTEAG
jgi:hypothetical protein